MHSLYTCIRGHGPNVFVLLWLVTFFKTIEISRRHLEKCQVSMKNAVNAMKCEKIQFPYQPNVFIEYEKWFVVLHVDECKYAKIELLKAPVSMNILAEWRTKGNFIPPQNLVYISIQYGYIVKLMVKREEVILNCSEKERERDRDGHLTESQWYWENSQVEAKDLDTLRFSCCIRDSEFFGNSMHRWSIGLDFLVQWFRLQCKTLEKLTIFTSVYKTMGV